MKIGILGLGYVGLPLAVQAVEKGHHVFGIDLDQRLVDKINRRVSPFVNDKRFNKAFRMVSSSSLIATTNAKNLADRDVVIICVPTPTIDNIPDLSFVKNAAESAARYLKKGQLIVLESTVNPGVTRDEVLPILEQTSGLKVGKDFCLAYCPERIDPGNQQYYVGNLNRVVGGIMPKCTRQATKFYRQIIDAEIVPLGSTEEAEFVKSWENTHRNVMIALANEAAVICDALNMDIHNVLKGLQSKIDQFGLKLANPGIGPGGHCIPEDIHYVIKKARQNGIHTGLLDSATDTNERMPQYAVHQLQSILKDRGKQLKDSTVALLGLAYKENIGDARRSPAINVAHLLVQRAKALIVHDPFIADSEITIKGARRLKSLRSIFRQADAVFIATAHDEYRQIVPEDLKRNHIEAVFDGRNCLEPELFVSAGIAYKGVGR